MFEDRLKRLEDQHLRRRLRVVDTEPGASGTTITIDGRSLILMASNNYLGLAEHPSVKKAAVQATERYGAGSGASRLISGTWPPHHDLEAALARFKQTDAALVFGAGYLANVGLIPALVEKGDLILADRLSHASLIDGCRLSGADLRIFAHNDMGQLDKLLAGRAAPRRTLVVTEGVFSMDGDLAPLPDLIAIAERHGASVLVDDAHGTGVMGTHGRGTLEHFGVEARLPFHMGTLGKALGTCGAYVAGRSDVIEYLLNTARSFLYATAPPPGTMAASTAALDVVAREPERRARLWANRDRLHTGLKRAGFRLTDSQSPILPVIVGDPDKAVAMAARLLDLGVFAPAIRPPTVPKETSRIRATVSSEHTSAQLDAALAAFEKAGRASGLI